MKQLLKDYFEQKRKLGNRFVYYKLPHQDYLKQMAQLDMKFEKRMKSMLIINLT